MNNSKDEFEMETNTGCKSNSIAANFANIYIYIVWFVHRNFKSSFQSLHEVSLFQAIAAPGIPFGCYLMAFYYFFEISIDISFDKHYAYTYAGAFIIISMFLIAKYLDSPMLMAKFKEFEIITVKKRRYYDIIVWLFLVFAIPTALTAAVMARNRFAPRHTDLSK